MLARGLISGMQQSDVTYLWQTMIRTFWLVLGPWWSSPGHPRSSSATSFFVERPEEFALEAGTLDGLGDKSISRSLINA